MSFPQIRWRVVSILTSAQFTAEIILVIAALLMFVVLVGKILQPVAPFFTIIFVVIGTMLTFDTDKKYGALSVTGLTLYLVSWPLTAELGAVVGVSVCCVGIFFWFAAFEKSIARLIPTA